MGKFQGAKAATGAVLGDLPLADADDLDRALVAAERGFRLWKKSTADERSRVLRGAATLLRERIERIARTAPVAGLITGWVRREPAPIHSPSICSCNAG